MLYFSKQLLLSIWFGRLRIIIDKFGSKNFSQMQLMSYKNKLNYTNVCYVMNRLFIYVSKLNKERLKKYFL